MRVGLAVAAAVVVAATAAAPRQAPVPRLAHVVVVVLENRERSDVIGGGSPLLTSYAHRYADLTSYYAVAHPSLPNYLALVSGSTDGITSDCTTCVVRGSSIGTLLGRAHRSWGGYAQGYPGGTRFAKKHMPFLYFSPAEGHVHPLGALDPRRLPSFAFVAPDLCADGHDCPLSSVDAFLGRFLPPLLSVPRTAVFVVFDEGTTDAGGGGHVAALVLGAAVRPHSVDRRRCSHYCLLRTVEDALGVGHLGASAHAEPLTGIWR
ncbi:MAG TPA: alkaline phosphatase family protein [Gaiellaceae bacterium]